MNTTNEPILYCWNTVYPYELLNECKADFDEKTGTYILDTLYRTTDVPPPPKQRFAICRNIPEGRWEYVEDHRGKKYWLSDMSWQDQGIPVLYPGELPPDATFTPPLKPAPIYRAELEKLLDDKKKRMRASGIEINGIRFSTSEKAMRSYLTFIEVNRDKENAKQEGWEASDNVWITMTLPLCREVQLAAHKFVDSCFGWYKKKKAELDALPDNRLHEFIV